MKKIKLSDGAGQVVRAHGYELDPQEKYVIDIKEELTYSSAVLMSFQAMGAPPAIRDYYKWLEDNHFDVIAPNPTNVFVAPYYGVKPLWKTNLSQGIVVKAQDTDEYYIVMECSRENSGYKYAKILVTLGGCL